MAATVGELLEQAQRAAWDLARARADLKPGKPNWRAQQTWPTLREHLEAWPALASAGHTTLGLIAEWPPTPFRRIPLDNTLRSLVMTSRTRAQQEKPTGTAESTDTDHGVARIARLIKATGDLLADADRPHDPEDWARVESKVLAVLETTARTTRVYLDEVPSGRTAGTDWSRTLMNRMIEHAHEMQLHPPGQRNGRYDDLAAYQPEETSLGAAITRWGTAAQRMLADPRAGSSGAQRAAADAALLLGGARTVLAAADVYALASRLPASSATSIDAAQRAWVEAARSWSPHLLVPGAPDREFLQASRDLGQQLHDELRPEGQWRLSNGVESLPTLAPVMRQALTTIEQTGWQYRETITRWANEGRLATPARRLDRRDLQDRPDLVRAQVAGRWVTLEPGSSRTPPLVQAATIAHTASQTAAGAAQLGSRAARHPFGTPIAQPSNPTPARPQRRTSWPPTPGTGAER